MVDNIVLRNLFEAFPKGIINRNIEFVADPDTRVNSYFRLDDCGNHWDVEVKLLSYLSREAYKSQHFHSERRNKQVHDYHLNGINYFCRTKFTPEDMELIYTKLGNGINIPLAYQFVCSNYSMEMLRGGF